MGGFERLKDLFDPKERKYTLEGKNIKIGKGVLICDNVIIPLDAISFIETMQRGKMGYGKWPLLLLAGIGMLFISATIIVILGVLSLIISIVNIVYIYLENCKEVYYLQIQNHAGRYYYISTNDRTFIEEIRDAFLICIDDKSVMYNGGNRVMMIDGDLITGDKITAAGGMNIGSIRNSGTIGSGDVISGEGKKTTAGRDMIFDTEGNVTTSSVNFISDEEWKILKEFAQARMKDFSEDERNFIICKNLVVLAEKKDNNRCQSLLKKAGKAALDIILSTASVKVKSIINRLMWGF